MDDKTKASNVQISLEQLEHAPKQKVPDPSLQAAEEQKMLAHKEKEFKNELGWLGKLFGGRKEKPGNISGLVMLLCFLVIVVIYFFPPSKDIGTTFGEIFSTLFSIVTLILGYLFGSNDRN